MKQTRFHFLQREFPSANMVLIGGDEPILVDTGFGSDIAAAEEAIKELGIQPDQLRLIVNTHYHSDHVGGNHHFQQRYGVPIAAHRWDAEMINRRDREACCAEWLDQPVEPYIVNQALSDGDEIAAGEIRLRVIDTPGHTLGHLSLYSPEHQILIGGDLFHRDDVGWINIYREGVASLHRSLESLEQVARLPLQRVYPGHGPAIDDPQAAIEAAKRRYTKWLSEPDKMNWHAVKRIFAFTLMIRNGLAEHELEPYLLTCGWFRDFSIHAFRQEPHDFAKTLLDEMLRSGAAVWQGNMLTATTPFLSPAADWSGRERSPANW